eukprot:scaffold270_cov347-Pavlova_lutheri.AAC.25
MAGQERRCVRTCDRRSIQCHARTAIPASSWMEGWLTWDADDAHTFSTRSKRGGDDRGQPSLARSTSQSRRPVRKNAIGSIGTDGCAGT